MCIYICVCVYIYVNIHILFQILFTYRLWQDIEPDSLCYGRSLLFIYFIYKINNNNNLNVKTRSFVVFAVQLPSHVWLFVTPRNCRHARPPCPSPSPSLPKCMSIESVMPSNHLILCHPLLPSIFPESGSFPVSQLFAPGGKSTIVSASVSVLSMNTQDWFPLGWTGGSPCSPKDSQESSQHHSSKAPVLRHSAFFIVKLSHAHMTTGKIMAFTS